MSLMSETALAGRARGSDTIDCLEVGSSTKIVQIGDDAGIIMPEHKVFGVFDGAGGASDIGSPRMASMVACQAVENYFEDGGQSTAEAMEHARQAVIMDKEAGVCVGAIARIIGREMTVVNAGDTAVALCRDGVDEEQIYLTEPQMDYDRQPRNYLGHSDRPGRLPERVQDEVAEGELKDGDMLFMMTDGAWSVGGEPLEFYHFKAARADWPEFERVKTLRPELQEEIRQLLHSDEAKSLREREIAANSDYFGRLHEDMVSEGLLDPERYSLEHTDWLIWHEIIEPYLENLGLLRQRKFGAAAIARSLITQPIRWPFETLADDDATAIVVSL